MTRACRRTALWVMLFSVGCSGTIRSASPEDAQTPGDGTVEAGAEAGPQPDGGPPPQPDGGPPPQPDGGPPPASFRFLAWADTKDGTDVLAALSAQAQAFAPDLTIYPGDLVSSGFSTSAANTWKTALNANGANAMFDITFPTRGNHDTGSDATWQSYFNLSARTTAVGASNYAYMTDSLTYSFDYGNAHFIGIDVLGDVTLMTSPELAWVDNDLAQAEVRGLTHAFLFWHGPIYPVGGHCCPADSAVIDVLNTHPIVSATFHGHEHNIAWVHIGTGRYSNVTHEFEEFVVGGGGAGLYSCQSGRSDFCTSAYGFAIVNVTGSSFTVDIYEQGNSTAILQRSFTK